MSSRCDFGEEWDLPSFGCHPNWEEFKGMIGFWYLRLRDRLAEVVSDRDSEEEGQGMVEYALILVLIAIVVIVILTVVGHRVSDVFSNINKGLSG
jgi:pilus assembly protein Flp/PilA